jgi:predicted transcriptional regulator
MRISRIESTYANSSFNVGDNIRRERLAKAISQQRLAEIADLNIRNVQRIEAGELDVLLTTVVRIRNFSRRRSIRVTVGHRVEGY